MANTIDWGKATQNNTNGFGKYQNTIDAGSIYADSYSGETVLIGTSAAFSYAKSSYHQDETDPTPTITGTTGGTFSATPSGLSINASTGTIDLSASTIQPYTITYTVDGVSANFSLSVTASPFVANTYSMQFDGVNDYIDVGNPSSLQITGNLTLSTWVKTSMTSTGFVISKDNLSNRNYALVVAMDGGTLKARFFIVKSNTLVNVTSNTINVGDNNWHHIVGVNDGTDLKIYVDGNLENTNSGAGGTIDNDSVDLNIGRRGDNNLFFSGKLDETAIWNTALSSDAVQEIYDATANNTGKALDLSTDYNNYTSSSNLQYWNRLGD